jgi:hypothetical protein
VEVTKDGTRSNTRVLMLFALVPAGMWAAAMTIVGGIKGYHSTAGIWVGMFGLPGLVPAAWIYQWTDSEAVSYLAAFLCNWLFWYFLIEVVLALKRRLTRSR